MVTNNQNTSFPPSFNETPDIPPYSPPPQKQNNNNSPTTPPNFASNLGVTKPFGKKYARKKIIATILVLLMVIGGVGSGIILVKQPQELREKAFYKPQEVSINCIASKKPLVAFRVTLKATSETPTCPDNRSHIQTVDTNSYSTDFLLSAEASPRVREIKVKIHKVSFYCQEPYGVDGECASSPIESDEWITLKRENNFQQTITISRNSPSGQACGSFQNDIVISDIENCPQYDPSQWRQYLSWGLCLTGISCASPPPSETPTPTPTPPAVSCLDTRAYKVVGAIDNPASWVRLTTTELQSLNEGDIIYFTVRGQSSSGEPNGGFTKAEFTINFGPPVESTTLKPQTTSDENIYEFYLRYEIPARTDYLEVKTRLYHPYYGWI